MPSSAGASPPPKVTLREAQQVEELYERLGEKRLFTREGIEFMQLLLHRIHDVEKLRYAEVSEKTNEFPFEDAHGNKHVLKHLRNTLYYHVGAREDKYFRANFEEMNLPEGVVTMTIKNALGNEHEFKIPLSPWIIYSDWNMDVKPLICFFSYQQAIMDPPLRTDEVGCHLLKHAADLHENRPILPKICPWGSWRSLAAHYIPMYFGRDLDKEYPWETSKLNVERAKEVKQDSKLERDAILKAIDDEARVAIRKIVCFGLGSLRTATRADGRAEYLLHQHYSALDIAESLEVPIIFQDPAYDEDDKAFLRSVRLRNPSSGSLEVDFVDSPEGLYAIDHNTLVFCTGKPAFPIRQLVADLTHEYGGPAAIFCHTVEAAAPWTVQDADMKQWTNEDEVNSFRCDDSEALDPVNRHVVNMLKNFKEALNVFTWFASVMVDLGNEKRIPKHQYNYFSSLYLKRGTKAFSNSPKDTGGN